ncbi:hypothetical protein CEUSTIGMA_g7388.t1 [Chlamydomonas eustigma]|uniref:lipoyl(octanoyl) transferase n=1 Tax=Chlamydomonas eustigma TaxID=1157962 RepID=A0A250XAM8_9CHLO|nr:hypothetical protein CEUSTIGMA_g7388.t1 [Chlamydomonas eustigma]|eukprot:GAX79949.1 hypothetical protein CEUSTIGMA_g7388.t1 [Chlamydomonas eustigma]
MVLVKINLQQRTSTGRFAIRRQYSWKNAGCISTDNLTDSPDPRRFQRCQLIDLHDKLVPYQQAWDFQRTLVDKCILDSEKGRFESHAAVILQHPSVYTLGAGSTEDNILFDTEKSSIPLFRTERGGEVTYHGPGQLVLYPILNLQRLGRADLHEYMRSLEEVVIMALREVSGIQGGREPGLTGVWVDGQKVAAIGIRAKRWVTYHGLALNVTTDLTPFEAIVPCGISDRAVGSVKSLLLKGNRASGDSRANVVQDDLELITEYRYALLEAFQSVFGLELSVVHYGSQDQPESLILESA